MSSLIKLDNLKPNPKAKHRKKRVGRGHGSGHGKTSGRGHKGQKAREGLDIKPTFEGGQTPIVRRIPKRGFNNVFKVRYEVVNIKGLAEKFKAGDLVDPETLRLKGLVKGKNKLIKVLGDGDLNFPLTVRVHACSKSAKEKIERAGGKLELISK